MNKTQTRKTFLILTFVVLSVCCIFLAVLFINMAKETPNEKTEPTKEPANITEAPTALPTEVPTPEPLTYKDYELISVGDAMLYTSMMNYAKQCGENGEYDFTDLTKYLKDIVEKADVAVFNMEATMLGKEPYTQYPEFNVPDSFATSLKNIGFDVSLFANNHTYDTRHDGLIKTQETLEREGFTVLGMRKNTNEKSYKIVKAGDLSIGMLNFTYDSDNREDGAVRLNGIAVSEGDSDLIDTFNLNRLDEFYAEVASRINEMKSDGADVIVFYIHWGEEYENEAGSTQKKIAQRLADIGADVIIGSHPHVVQPVEVITAEDGRIVPCYYSLGNFTSLQNRITLPKRAPYTEYELMAKAVIRKYSDGRTFVSEIGYEPLYQHRVTNLRHQIVPLRAALSDDASIENYGLNQTSTGAKYAKAALEYIDGLVSPGVNKFNQMRGNDVDE